jgi:quinoprotein relay system zinc metallohydrolase 2
VPFLQELAQGIYLHQGVHADLDDAERGNSANLGVIVGTRCIAVVDTGGSLDTGTSLREAISSLSEKPICYVINTHVHFDHVLANTAFADSGAQFVGHHNLADAIAANKEFFAQNFANELGVSSRAAEIPSPTIVVETQTILDIGDRQLKLQAVATAHSESDLTILDMQTSTFFAGDLLFRERLPIVDGSLHGWQKWLDKVTQERYQLVVPGHGPVDRAWPVGAEAQEKYLNALVADTRASIAAGEFVQDAVDHVAAEELKGWVLTERAHGRNVSRAFRELEWEE